MIQIKRGIFFMKRSIDSTPMVKSGGDGAYKFGTISYNQIVRDPLFAARGKVEKFTARLKEGHHCFGFLDRSGAVAYYMWVTQAQKRPMIVPFHLGVFTVVPAGSSYIWDCFTVPEHRRRGLYSRGLVEATAHSINDGAEQVFICCAKENTASISGIHCAGFHDIFEYRVAGFTGIRFIRKIPGPSGLTFIGHTYDILKSTV